MFMKIPMPLVHLVLDLPSLAGSVFMTHSFMAVGLVSTVLALASDSIDLGLVSIASVLEASIGLDMEVLDMDMEASVTVSIVLDMADLATPITAGLTVGDSLTTILHSTVQDVQASAGVLWHQMP